MSVKLDQLLNMTAKGVTPQDESAQAVVLKPGSRLTITKAEKVFTRTRQAHKHSRGDADSDKVAKVWAITRQNRDQCKSAIRARAALGWLVLNANQL
ncbi:hypothetical protein WJX77_004772 [Trebouxia sp. C0004]